MVLIRTANIDVKRPSGLKSTAQACKSEASGKCVVFIPPFITSDAAELEVSSVQSRRLWRGAEIVVFEFCHM